ncbi:MAG: hypothetical protein DELT_00272 [Desulfovibrio sp.]
MFQRNTSYFSSFRSRSRLRTLFLYFCLVISVTWYEPGFKPSTAFTPQPTVVAERLSKHNKFALIRLNATHRLPSLLASAPRPSPGTRLRPENPDGDFPPLQLFPCWAIVDNTPCLPSLRIDPIMWESRTPSFLLPSAYGLVPFAIPPPCDLV